MKWQFNTDFNGGVRAGPFDQIAVAELLGFKILQFVECSECDYNERVKSIAEAAPRSWVHASETGHSKLRWVFKFKKED